MVRGKPIIKNLLREYVLKFNKLEGERQYILERFTFDLMKTLYIVRHAKSSWDDMDLDDFERPLNERGKRDAPTMGKRLKEKAIVVDQILSSPAKRALSTAKRIAKVLEYKNEHIKTDQRLYHANHEVIISVLRSVKDKFDTVMIFGHNPGLTDFVNDLMKDKKLIDNVPTCGVVAFELPIEAWSELQSRTGKFLFFDFPKSLAD
jgi:phosphohistidine phosphatase